ncbi:MAG: NAD(P)-dependent dehydrogenase (short-subunit alcohol dehydrogenase family) [Alphaproteobacteria bacterium]|jgi:NAD(P)-dependent dehydrogenase (short-subunit alcohol dehydrogenase family)
MAKIDLTGKVVIVTGASRGMGREMADAIIEAGGKAGLLSPDVAELKKTVGEINAARGDGSALALPYDISDYAQCELARDETIRGLGGLHMVVNNAALGQLNVIGADATDTSINFWETDPARWAQVIKVNVVGTYNMCRAVTPHLLKQGWGRLVNVTTSLGTIQRKGNAPYGPSKGAIEAETLIFAQELKGTGVTSNSLIPGGAAATAFVPKNYLTDRKLVDPAVMRDPIVWLASEHSDGHTGGRYLGTLWDAALEPTAAAKGALEPPVYRVPGGQIKREWS